MFRLLVSRNEDLERLVKRGYAVAFDSGHLIVRDIPYLDAGLNLQWGAFVAKLEFVDQERVKQTDHQVLFAGGVPHGIDGKPVPSLGGGQTTLALSPAARDVVVQRSFSNKPTKTQAFADFFEKIETYVGHVCTPAMEQHGADPLTFRVVEEIGGMESVFKFHDGLTHLAGISDLTAKLKDDVVAVIGLGGTGAFLLDFLVKTPVKEIRGFDHDTFHVHNAYRAPGPTKADGEFGKPKVEVYRARYQPFRHGLLLQQKYIDASCAADLQGVTFAFVCVDKGPSRAGIFDLLTSLKIPFIDVGMGLRRKNGALTGMARVTYYPSDRGQEIRDKNLAELNEAPEDEYRTNIQISETNALNACLAVLRFKQIRGFYVEETPYYHLLFGFADLESAGEV